MSQQVERVLALTRKLSAGDLLELRNRLIDLWGDEPPATGVREPRNPRPSSGGARLQKREGG